MNINLKELLPDEIAEDITFCMEKFMLDFAFAVNSYCGEQKRRCKECRVNRYLEECERNPF